MKLHLHEPWQVAIFLDKVLGAARENFTLGFYKYSESAKQRCEIFFRILDDILNVKSYMINELNSMSGDREYRLFLKYWLWNIWRYEGQNKVSDFDESDGDDEEYESD